MTLQLNKNAKNELALTLQKASGDLSYYNAAEGESWFKEKSAREVARRWYIEVAYFAAQVGVRSNHRNYLL